MNFLELLKKFWFLPVFLILFIYFFVKDQQNTKIIEEMRKSYSTFILEQNKIQEIENKQREEAIKTYQNKLSELEKKYNNSLVLLERERKNKIKIIAMEMQEPAKLSLKIKQMYGFKEYKE